MRKWFSSTPKINKFSRENCDLLCRHVHTYEQTSDPAGRMVDAVVETIRALSEIVLWGDKFDPDTFYTFLESNMMACFLKLVSNPKVVNAVKVQIIQTLTILIQNLTNEASVFSLLSNNIVNRIIATTFDFEEEEVMSNYISFLKTLSLRLNPQTIQFFYHKEQYYFPLYSEGIKFFQHDDCLVRTSVRALALNVFKVFDPAVRQYIEENGDKFFNQFAWFLHDQFVGLYDAVSKYDWAMYSHGATHSLLPMPQMSIFSEDLIDDFLFVNDLIELPSEKLVTVLESHLRKVALEFLLTPVLDAVHLFILAQWINTSNDVKFLASLLPAVIPHVTNALVENRDPRILHTALLVLHNARRNRDLDLTFLATTVGCELRAPPKDSVVVTPRVPPDVTPPSAISHFSVNEESPIRPGDAASIRDPALPPPPYPPTVLSGVLYTLARSAANPSITRMNTMVLSCLLLQEVLGVPDNGGYVVLPPAESEVLKLALMTSLAVLQRRVEEHRQALYDMYVTHTRPHAQTTGLNTSTLFTNLEGSRSREVFDPLELLYIRLHSAYPMFSTLVTAVVGPMLHDPVAMLPSLAPLSPDGFTCALLHREGAPEDQPLASPTDCSSPRGPPVLLAKIPLPSRCPLSLDELEVVEILTFLLLRKWYCTLQGLPDTVPKICAKNKARYVSGSEVNTSDLSDRCGMVGVRCQFCPPLGPEDAASPMTTAPGTVLYLFLEGDVVLLVEPSTAVLGKGTVTFCFPAFYSEAVIDPKFAFKLTLRCESIVHGARCCVVLAFRDTTTSQAIARHVNSASQAIRKRMCADVLGLITTLPGME